MRVFVTGVSSTPGYKIALELVVAGYEVYGQYNAHPVGLEGAKLLKLDLTDAAKAQETLGEIRPDIVIHTAALGDVDKCEEDKAYCYAVNTAATAALAKKAAELGSYFIYLSTDYVFDGERGMYKEEDPPNPVNYYGLTKLLAEHSSLAVPKSAVVRTSHIYGTGPGRKNFARAVLESLREGKEVRALVDQWLSPTLNTLLAKAIREIMERELTGIFHVAGQRASRYEFATAIARKFGLDERLIKPAQSSEIKFKARRPRDSSLDCTRARDILKTEFHSLDYSLEVWKREVGSI